MNLSKKQIQHLYNRAGFGITPSELNRCLDKTQQENIQYLFETSKAVQHLNIDLSEIILNRKDLSKEENKKQRKLERNKLKELNIIWLQYMIKNEGVLREKMAFFFHDHFAVRLNSAHANLQLVELIR